MNSPSIGMRLVPSLLVREISEAVSFYEALGFTLTGVSPNRESPTWAEVQRDTIAFQFYTEPPVGMPKSPICSGTFYLYPDSVAELANVLKDKMEFEWGPEKMEYGMYEFGIRDPNGYILAFTEPA